ADPSQRWRGRSKAPGWIERPPGAVRTSSSPSGQAAVHGAAVLVFSNPATIRGGVVGGRQAGRGGKRLPGRPEAQSGKRLVAVRFASMSARARANRSGRRRGEALSGNMEACRHHVDGFLFLRRE